MQKLVVMLLPSIVAGRRVVAGLRLAGVEHRIRVTDWALAYKDEHLQVHLEEGHGSWRPGAHSTKTLRSIDHAVDPGEAMVLLLTDEASVVALTEHLSSQAGPSMEGLEGVDRYLVRLSTFDVGDAHHVYKVLRGLAL